MLRVFWFGPSQCAWCKPPFRGRKSRELRMKEEENRVTFLLISLSSEHNKQIHIIQFLVSPLLLDVLVLWLGAQAAQLGERDGAPGDIRVFSS